MKNTINLNPVTFIGLSFVLLLFMPLANAAQAGASVPVTATASISPDEARQAIIDAARLLFVPVTNRGYEDIDRKSMHVSTSSAEFNGDRKGYGRGHYTIRFAALGCVFADCSSTACWIRSNPPGALARKQTGEAIDRLEFVDPFKNNQKSTTCLAECQKIAVNFAAALNSFHQLELLGPTFHEKAAAWRALTTKPPLPDNVHLQRLLAEDALKNHKPGEALQHYEAGLKLYSTWPQGWFNAAMIAGQLGIYANAAEDMQAYLELVPDAKDAQSARDQIEIWKYKAKQGSAGNAGSSATK
jgi:hypothetical protein